VIKIRRMTDLAGAFDAMGAWIAGAGFDDIGSPVGVGMTRHPSLNTLVSFTGADGASPAGALIADARGDLFGATFEGGPDGDGTVFEIARTKSGYASAPTTLVAFDKADGMFPTGALVTDALGDLFGMTGLGGTHGEGTVFEIVKTQGGYASAPTILVSFTGADGGLPDDGLIVDAAGDLFGTTSEGGVKGVGTVFEIARTRNGYAHAPTTLASFKGADGEQPAGALFADAAGDLLGTTISGGADDDGTVFEIAKTKSGYASAPKTLVSFTGADGLQPNGSLIADAAGNLFGTTSYGGTDNRGTVFEIARTKSGYASTPTTLVSFTGADGEAPLTALIIDASGNLFGTTFNGGRRVNGGTVFEIAKTNGGYASAPITLANFTGANGKEPQAALMADASGNLFGSASTGGADGDGTVFEIINSGYMPPASPPAPAAFAQAMASHAANRFAGATATLLPSRNAMPTLMFRPHAACF
jgi:hypothetical protein